MALAMLLKLSLRNVVLYRRRNAFLLIAISFAVGGVTVSNALIRGWQNDMLEMAVANLTGHIKVQAPGFVDDPSLANSLTLALPPILPGDARLYQGWAARIRLPAVVMSERATRGAQLVGIDPQQEAISFYRDLSIQGRGLAGVEDRSLLIGAALADALETKVDRRVVIMVQGADGRTREMGYRVAGIYDAPGELVEKMFIFTGLEALQQRAAGQRPLISELSIVLHEESNRLSVLQAVQEAYPDTDVRDWQALEPQFAELYNIVDSVMLIWFLLTMTALAFGLVNTLIAAVMERVRELGMLRALGMGRGFVVLQVVIESVCIMSIGVALGLLLGVFGVWLLADGIDLTAFSDGLEGWGIRARLVPLLAVEDLVGYGLMSVLIGFIASFFPARCAVKISPLMAMNR